MDEIDQARISLDAHPELRDAINALLERRNLSYNDRKRLERWRRQGLPDQITPFMRDPGMARALLAAAEQQQQAA